MKLENVSKFLAFCIQIVTFKFQHHCLSFLLLNFYINLFILEVDIFIYFYFKCKMQKCRYLRIITRILFLSYNTCSSYALNRDNNFDSSNYFCVCRTNFVTRIFHKIDDLKNSNIKQVKYFFKYFDQTPITSRYRSLLVQNNCFVCLLVFLLYYLKLFTVFTMRFWYTSWKSCDSKEWLSI